MIVGELIDRCLNTFLLGTYSQQFNVLKTDVNATQVEFDANLPMGEITPGSLVAIEDELLHVYDRDDTNNRFLAVRGVRGTDPAAHPAHTAVEINPRFPHFLVRSAMIEELDSWPDALYSAQSFTAGLPSLGSTIPIPADVNGFTALYPIRLRRASLAFDDARYRRTKGWDTLYSVDVDGNDTMTVMVNDALATTTNYVVSVACKFNTEAIGEFGDAADLSEDVGLQPGMLEILELGACWRLLTARAGIRLFPEAQGQSRSAAEVGAHDITVLSNALLGLRQRAISREIERLVKRWGFGGA